MTTLVIPDIHNHTEEAEIQIEKYPADRVVFLGDYFDNFGDTAAIAKRTAKWLKQSLRNPNRIHLWGNHDLWYAFPGNRQICWIGSGFTPEKREAIDKTITTDDWAKLKPVVDIDGIVLSHAGIDPRIFTHPVHGLTFERICKQCEKALENAKAAIPDLVFDTESGPFWLRWWALPVLDEFSQIVGHTPSHELNVETGGKQGKNFNICLDSFGRYLAMIDNGNVQMIDDHGEKIVWESKFL